MIGLNEVHEVILEFVQHGDADKFVVEFSKLSFGVPLGAEQDAIDLIAMVDSKVSQVYVGHISRSAFREWLQNNVLSGKLPEAATEAENVRIEWFKAVSSNSMGRNASCDSDNINLYPDSRTPA